MKFGGGLTVALKQFRGNLLLAVGKRNNHVVENRHPAQGIVGKAPQRLSRIGVQLLVETGEVQQADVDVRQVRIVGKLASGPSRTFTHQPEGTRNSGHAAN